MSRRSIKTEKDTQTRMLAKALAPDDIRPDQYVAVLHVIREFAPCADYTDYAETSWRPIEPVRIRLTPRYTAHPMKVIDVCLPYVLVKEADGDIWTLDTRRHQLARVTGRFGRTAAERVRARLKSRKKADDDDDD